MMPPTLAACTVTPPSSTKTPPPAETSTLFSTSAIFYLSNPPRYLRNDVRLLRWAVAHVSLDHPPAEAWLLGGLRTTGAEKQATR